MLFFIQLLASTLLLSLLNVLAEPITLPATDGGYNVTIFHTMITDVNRTDPYTNQFPRNVMLSIFFPIPYKNCTKFCLKPYMPAHTSKVTSQQFFGDPATRRFEQLQFMACCETNMTMHPGEFPVVFLDPAVGTTRHLYGALAQGIAGHGFVVITVDHPFDASIVEVEGQDQEFYNKIELSPFEDIMEFNRTSLVAISTRAIDIGQVISQLDNSSWVKQLIPTAPEGSGFNISSMGIVGHGMGGVLASWMAFTHPNFAVAIDWDGTTLKYTVSTTKPVVVFGRDDHTRDMDTNWRERWGLMQGKKWWWNLKAAKTFDYSDLPLVVSLTTGMKVNGDVDTSSAQVKGLGDVGLRTAWNITGQFTAAYLNAYLKGKDAKPLQGLVALYPDMMPYVGNRSIEGAGVFDETEEE